MRILIVGIPGSGKTTLARRLSAETGLAHFELDRVFWIKPSEPNPKFFEACREIADKSEWIVEGHFTKTSEIFLPRADRILWLKTPRALSQWRIFRRFLKRETPLSRVAYSLRFSKRNENEFSHRLNQFMHRVETLS